MIFAMLLSLQSIWCTVLALPVIDFALCMPCSSHAPLPPQRQETYLELHQEFQHSTRPKCFPSASIGQSSGFLGKHLIRPSYSPVRIDMCHACSMLNSLPPQLAARKNPWSASRRAQFHVSPPAKPGHRPPHARQLLPLTD